MCPYLAEAGGRELKIEVLYSKYKSAKKRFYERIGQSKIALKKCNLYTYTDTM